MRIAAVWFTILTLLMASTAAAQSPVAADAIVRAFERQAAKVAAADAAVVRPPGGTWGDVIRLAPGAKVRVTVDTALPAEQVFLAASDVELITLNTAVLDDDAAARALIRAASDHPDQLLSLRQSDTLQLDNGVRIHDGTIFLKHRRLADVNVVIRRVPKPSVREVGVSSVSGRKIAGTVVGAVGGFFAGAFLGAALENTYVPCNCDDPGFTGALIGMAIGPIAGGMLGYRLTPAGPAARVIYRG